MLGFMYRPKVLVAIFGCTFLIAVAIKAPASLVAELCRTSGVECHFGKTSGTLYSGQVGQLSVSAKGQYFEVDKLEWRASIVDFVLGDTWLHVDARDGANFARSSLDLSRDELRIEKLMASWSIGSSGVIKQPVELTASINNATVNIRDNKVIDLDGRVSVAALNLGIQSQSFNVGAVEAFLRAAEGKIIATPSNEDGDFALTGECGISLAGYDCGIRVDASSSTDDINKLLSMAATSKNADSIYSYDLTGAW